MKPIKIILAAILCTVCLSGCGFMGGREQSGDNRADRGYQSAKEDQTDPKGAETDPEGTETEEKDPEGAKPKETEPQQAETGKMEAEETEPAIEVLHPVIVSKKLSLSRPDHYEMCSVTTWDTVRLSDEEAAKYPLLAKALDGYSGELDRAARSQHQDCVQEVQNYLGGLEEEERERGTLPDTWYSELEEWPFYMNFEYKDLLMPVRSDSVAFTMLEDYYCYMGGAHGYYAYDGVNFDTGTGKELLVEDVITDVNRLNEILFDRLMTEYADLELEENVVRDTLTGSASGEYSYHWLLSQDRVTFYFNPYELTYYAGGMQEIGLLFTEYPELFYPQYVEAPKEYIRHMGKGGYIDADIDNDGQYERIFTYVDENSTDYLEETDKGNSGISISIDGNTKSFTQPDGYDGDIYFIHTENGNYLYFFVKYYDTSKGMFFDLSGGGITRLRKAGSVLPAILDNKGDGRDLEYAMNEGSQETAYAPLADTRCFYLETENGKQLYHVGKDGLPEEGER